ncbi:AAA family ATPase [Flavobacterium sp. GCM10027622]|uniref:AAA family ATPase n=1 Tax=unclassified Flavobacterium TaxID=196869 RepID=UPI003623FCC6
MEKARLIVKNFGPLKDIAIEVREMVTFIGAQASGKSTLAKLLSILEDENFRRDHKITFEGELKKYNIFSYLRKDTFISYDNLSSSINFPFKFEYTNGQFEKGTPLEILSHLKTISKEDRDKNKDILFPVIINALCWNIDYSLSHNPKIFFDLFSNSQEKIDLLQKIVNQRKTKQRPAIEESDINTILNFLNKEKNVDNLIELYETVITLFPRVFLFDSLYIPTERIFLHLIAENTLGLINNNVQIPKHLLESGQDYEKALHTIKELPLTIIDKKIKYKREGKTSYIYHNEVEKVDLLESASGLQSIIPILLLVEYAKSQKDKYNFNFVVEEPELNLYPKAQHELIKYLVGNCLFDRKNLIITTHSPFVLASLNNLLLAHEKGIAKPKEVSKIIKKESWLNPKNFIAYELKNGKAKKIMDDKLGLIKENMIDSVTDAFSDEFDKLLDTI